MNAADDAALLEAIWARPDDDGPRRVYADALLARGDPRGELIHLSLAAAAGNREAAERARKLQLQSWDESLPRGVTTAALHRGFPSAYRVKVPRAQWPAVLPLLAKLEPFPHQLYFEDGSGVLSRDGRWLALTDRSRTLDAHKGYAHGLAWVSVIALATGQSVIDVQTGWSHAPGLSTRTEARFTADSRRVELVETEGQRVKQKQAFDLPL